MTSPGRWNLADRLARFNRVVVNPAVRLFAGRRFAPVAVVEHRGRTSGRRYRTPVLAFGAGVGYAVALPYGPERDWVRNVVAAGSCTLCKQGRRVETTNAVVVAGRAGRAALPWPVAAGLRLLRVAHVLRLATVERPPGEHGRPSAARPRRA